MNLQRPLTFLGCAAIVAIASGCASSKKFAPAARELNAQTPFEQLRENFIANVKGAVPLKTEGNWVSLAAKAPNAATGAQSVAASDFAQWCQFQGGKLYLAADQDKPAGVKKAESLSGSLTKLARLQMETSYFKRSCEVQGNTYVLDSAHVSLGLQGYPAEIRYDGYTFAWLSPQDVTSKTEALDRAEAQARAERDAYRKKVEQEAQAAEQSRRETATRKAAVLQRSNKGTQLVCTGRQHSGNSIADIWYGCTGQNIGIVTFAEFNQNGWRVSSQTLAPVLMTSGNVEHDATVIFEKVR